MTKPIGENDMPPSYYRRKEDPKPIRFPQPPLFSKADLAVFVLLVLACLGMFFWAVMKPAEPTKIRVLRGIVERDGGKNIRVEGNEITAEVKR